MHSRSKARSAAVLLAATSAVALSVAASAADLPAQPVYKAPPVTEAPSPWQIRLRALGVITRDGGTVDQVPGSDLETSDTVVPELDITYYFTPNIAAELILGVTRHHVTGTGTIDGLDVGKAWLLPPTLTLQYHFTQFGAFKPYVGIGVNYTVFFDQDAGNTVLNGVAVTESKLKNTFGVAGQIGFDYMIDRHWGVNFDVKKLYLRPEWEGTLNYVVPVTGKVELDPWLIAGGVTYRF